MSESNGLFYPLWTIMIWKIFLSRPSMNNLEFYWIMITSIWFWLLYKRGNVALLLLSIPGIYPIILFTTTVFLGCFTRLRGRLLLPVARLVYTNYLNLPKIKSTTPQIFVCNYPANMIEYMFFMQSERPAKLLVFAEFAKYFVNFVLNSDQIISCSEGKSYDKTETAIKEALAAGYNVFSFVERDYFERPTIYNICKLRSGIFTMAQKNNWPISPLCWTHCEHFLGLVTRRSKAIIGKRLNTSLPIEQQQQICLDFFTNKVCSTS